MDAYYHRPEISNSDLSWLKKYWLPEGLIIDLEKAYADGTLVDCMITEKHRVNYFNYTVIDYPHQFTKEDFERSVEMKKAFQRDPFCAMLLKQACCQKISVRDEFEINYEGFVFSLPVRCKWDLFIEDYDLSGDIKSTACTTQKQFEEAVKYFDYDRQRAWYCDIEGRSNDMIIGISKVNFKIFKLPVKRGSELFKSGEQKYKELAFKFWYLFSDLTNIAA